jgi:hypothetical protein
MKICQVDDKPEFIDLPLLADEERKTIDKYISGAKMFILDDGVIENFFTNNYSRPIIEDGVLLRDMIILQKRLR